MDQKYFNYFYLIVDLGVTKNFLKGLYTVYIVLYTVYIVLYTVYIV